MYKYAGFLGDNVETTREQIEVIEEREWELQSLFEEVAEMVIDELSLPFSDDEEWEQYVEDIKEHTIEYIANVLGLPVWRPMHLEDAGGIFYEEYPYDHMKEVMSIG